MKALITGASSGIGKDMAVDLSNRGFDLVIVARNEKKLNDLKQSLKTNVEIIVMDLSIPDNCKKLHEQVKDVDLLVNNAGFGEFGEFIETDLEKEISLINTNIVALHILTKLYLIDMVKNDKGKILNVASIAGFIPGPLMATYYSSKAYVVRLSEAIREELKKRKSNVKISILCPGPVKTNFNNVANVKFGLSSLDSKYVAKYAINKTLKNRFLIIPGIKIKVGKFFSKIIPNNIISKIIYKGQTKKR